MRFYAPIYLFNLALLFVGMLLVGMSEAQAATETYVPVSPTLPAYMYIECDNEKGSPAGDSLISTTAKMMDFCGCENKLNPDGLSYAGSKSPPPPTSSSHMLGLRRAQDVCDDICDDISRAIFSFPHASAQQTLYFKSSQ